MAIIHDRISVAAGATVRNALQGSVFEFLRAPSGIRAGVVREAGAPAGSIRASFQIGDSETVRDRPVGAEVAVGAGIDTNRDLTIVEAGKAGERLVMQLVNNDVAAREVEFYVLIS